MKIITWILVLCFTSQVFAGTVKEDLTVALNNYEYDMVVDWDQKDMKKAEAFNENFAQAVEKLYDRGLTNEELLAAIELRSRDKAKFATLKAKANLLGNSASDARSVANLLQSELSDMGQRGASWNGDVQHYLMAIIPLVLVGALIIYQMVWNKTHRCASAARHEVCHDVCDDYSSHEVCDSNWDNCHTEEYCVRSHEECGLEEFCESWEKIPK